MYLPCVCVCLTTETTDERVIITSFINNERTTNETVVVIRICLVFRGLIDRRPSDAMFAFGS